MSQLNGVSGMPPGPSPEKVPLRGVSGRTASLVVVGAVAGVVGIALLGQGGDRPPRSGTAFDGPTESPAVTQWPTSAPAATWRSYLTPGPTPVPSPAERGSVVRSLPTGGTPLPDVAAALPGDDGSGPLPLGTITDVPNADRLDFLFELCPGDCFRDAHWIDPENPQLGSGVWTAGRPFHVREGFVNNAGEPLGDGFDVVLYVTRLDGGPEEPTYRYTSDYVLRGTSDRCGPNYTSQEGPETCEWFVHDFPVGLPAGRWAIWAAWEAPCRAWIDLGLTASCRDPGEVLSLFSSGFDAPYGPNGPSYTEQSP